MKPSQERVSAAPLPQQHSAGWEPLEKFACWFQLPAIWEKKALYCVTGGDIKVTLSSLIHTRWPVPKQHCGGVSWRRPPPDLNSFLPPYRLGLTKLPPAPFHSLMYGYFWPPLLISVSGLKAFRLVYTRGWEQQYLVFWPLKGLNWFQIFFFLLLDLGVRLIARLVWLVAHLARFFASMHFALRLLFCRVHFDKWQQSK